MSTRKKKPAEPVVPPPPPPPPCPSEWRARRNWSSFQHNCQRVRQVVEAIGAGEFHVPAFQRPFVWTDAQVIRLLDSLVDGYMTGAILCWERPAGSVPSVARLAGLDFPVKSVWGKLAVVDGQQRISALALAFFSGRFVYDCTTRCFVVDAPPDPDRLPLGLLLEPWNSAARAWQDATPDGMHKFYWLEEVLNCADMSIVTMPKEWTAARVAESYRRLATEGTPMDPDQVAEALARFASKETP
jgi:hypothetical protein